MHGGGTTTPAASFKSHCRATSGAEYKIRRGSERTPKVAEARGRLSPPQIPT
ncbi:MAG: hypothetical protein HQK89_15255 [Nitrospirae bacterium]|nr:hypothetical protein [Nitrospirota bacterium]